MALSQEQQDKIDEIRASLDDASLEELNTLEDALNWMIKDAFNKNTDGSLQEYIEALNDLRNDVRRRIGSFKVNFAKKPSSNMVDVIKTRFV